MPGEVLTDGEWRAGFSPRRGRRGRRGGDLLSVLRILPRMLTPQFHEERIMVHSRMFITVASTSQIHIE
jgi:hypothetical protein